VRGRLRIGFPPNAGQSWTAGSSRSGNRRHARKPSHNTLLIQGPYQKRERMQHQHLPLPPLIGTRTQLCPQAWPKVVLAQEEMDTEEAVGDHNGRTTKVEFARETQMIIPQRREKRRTMNASGMLLA
jgi:hypothetical protein